MRRKGPWRARRRFAGGRERKRLREALDELGGAIEKVVTALDREPELNQNRRSEPRSRPARDPDRNYRVRPKRDQDGLEPTRRGNADWDRQTED